MAQQILSTGTFTVAKFVVSADATQGNFLTIQAAITAASSGDTVYIRDGTFTESITLKAGVNLSSLGSSSSLNGTAKTIISGTCTLTTAGTVTISGIQLQTNSAAFLAVTGTLASVVNLNNCYLNCTNNTGITYSSSSASSGININDCNGNIGTTGISLFSASGAGNINMFNSFIANTGLSTTASTLSAGGFNPNYSLISIPITTSSTGLLQASYCGFACLDTNSTCLTQGGSTSASANECLFASGTASAITISTQLQLRSCQVFSSNTNAVTGAGTLIFTGLAFSGSSSVINTTTQSATYTNLGKYKATAQPAFSAYLASSDLNKTGTGTAFTLGSATALTKIFDQDNNFNTNGTFTAPVTGTYLLSCACLIQGCTIATTMQLKIVTTKRNYVNNLARAASANDFDLEITALCDMASGDTATFVVATVGEAGNTDDIYGAASGAGSDTWTRCSGYLVC